MGDGTPADGERVVRAFSSPGRRHWVSASACLAAGAVAQLASGTRSSAVVAVSTVLAVCGLLSAGLGLRIGLVVDAHGLHDRTLLRTRTIRWCDVRDIGAGPTHGRPDVWCVYATDASGARVELASTRTRATSEDAVRALLCVTRGVVAARPPVG